MPNINEKVVSAKTALLMVLGEDSTKYLSYMKLWFRYKVTKEEFDLEARKLLTPDKMYLHNQFLSALLNKIDCIVKPNCIALDDSNIHKINRKRKRSSRSGSERVIFEPFDIFDYLNEDNFNLIRPPHSNEDPLQTIPTTRYCVQELFLPDAGFIMGRMLVGAWEAGLVYVEDTVAEYVATAVQIFLKNVISSIVLKRRHYCVTGQGTFFYDIGVNVKNPFIRNTVTRQKIDDSPLEIDKEITTMNALKRNNDDGIFLSACEQLYPLKRSLITINDLYKISLDKNLIMSHALHSINTERMSQMLH